jgi:ribosomal protein S18 acetylase RimI-like enzyme
VATTFRPAERNDFAAIKRSYQRSFWTDPVTRWLFPDDEEFVSTPMMDDFFHRLLAYEHSLVTHDVVAFSLWIPPGRPDVDIESTVTEEPSDELITKFIALGSIIDANTPTDEHWYLQMIGTHPDWQGRGIGSTLIREGLSWARRDGLGVYLETETVENVAFYRHLGFEVRSEWDVPAGGPHMWGMWIPPA